MAKVNIVDQVQAMENKDKVMELISKQVRLPATIIGGEKSDGKETVQYADDILLLAKSMRAAERLLRTSTAYLEKKLKLKVNTEKSRAVSVYSIRNFGFSALRWEGTERGHISEFTQSRRRKPKINCEN